MDALNLANYIAIACFDLGILFLYYFFEWYQKRYNTKEKNDSASNNSNSNTEISIQNEDVHNTKSLA
jgi:hypothetical protein